MSFDSQGSSNAHDVLSCLLVSFLIKSSARDVLA
jgi:hypothetical protein